jgi:carbon-monoxide dehydrogenase medium subunit
VLTSLAPACRGASARPDGRAELKPPDFEYADPRTLPEAIDLLAKGQGEAKVLAGGQSLMPLLAMRLARPRLLVDLGRIEGLAGIREVDGQLAIGAMTTKRAVELSPQVRSHSPLLHEATRWIAHPQIRNRGTLGGSLAHADPAAEYPAVALLLGATLRVAGPDGERSIAAADFFLSYLTTALGPGDVLVEARFPRLPRGTGWSFQEFARRPGDFALVGCAASLAPGPGGRIASAHLVLFGVGPTPLRAEVAEKRLLEERPEARVLDAAAEAARESVLEPIADLHASAEFRRHLAGVLARRALAEAAARAGAAG